MSLPRHRIEKITKEMCTRLGDVLEHLFPGKVGTLDGRPTIPLSWTHEDGSERTYPAPVSIDGHFSDPTTSGEFSVWDLWKNREGKDDLSAAKSFYKWLGQDPQAALFPPIFATSRKPALSEVRSLGEILAVDLKSDLSSLIGFNKRFLGQGGSWVLIGPSGVGKSSLAMHLAAHLSGGRSWFGIEIRRPLNVLVVQKENDDGDLAEMLSGALGPQAGADGENQAHHQRLAFWNPRSQGRSFCEELRSKINECSIDVVILDPLLAHLSGDVSSQEVVAAFLRQQLQPVLEATRALAIVVHHTGKPSEARGSSKRDPLELSYSGIGSSEITNWARAIAVLIPAGGTEGLFRFVIVKRRGRSGLKSRHLNKGDEIFLQHASEGIGWAEAMPPPEKQESNHRRDSSEKQRPDPLPIVASIIESANGQMDQGDLVAHLIPRINLKEKAAKNMVKSLLKAGSIRVVHVRNRKGGGHPINVIGMPLPAGTFD